ncbi:MAG: pyridoxal-phosphate dependent enzyme [Anaerolineae bacterium]|nr:pyridoxal-phosphate dependent enzyme [Anaerolineae bacterium]
MTLKIVCIDCNAEAQPLDWRCRDCGGVLDFAALPPFSAKDIKMDDTSLWRYRDWLQMEQRITLGEGMTPLVKTEVDGRKFLAKLEYLNPTGSYKDRGTVTMMNHIAAYDVNEVIDDSSGNAGASVAAYASALGIPARIFVPESGSIAKKALIQAFGGRLEEVAGAQHLKTEACHKAAASTTYASHAWSPFFLLGQITAAFEIWEQTLPNWPDAIVVPVGHGALFLGIARGFKLIKQAGLIDIVPKMIAVQSEKIDPVVQGYESNAEVPPRVVETSRTIADGIMVDSPVRGKEILQTIRETNGAAFRVSDEAIQQAQVALAKRGLIVEATSAAAVAALSQVEAMLGENQQIVCCLTGNGLKNVGR